MPARTSGLEWSLSSAWRALFVGSIAAYVVGGAGLGFGIYVLSRDSSARAPASLAPSAAVLTWGTAF
jgi:hypothetical protein